MNLEESEICMVDPPKQKALLKNFVHATWFQMFSGN